MRYKRISADCHLDLIWLPPTSSCRGARDMKDRMPYVATGPRAAVGRNNGATFGLAGGVGASGTKSSTAASCPSTTSARRADRHRRGRGRAVVRDPPPPSGRPAT